METSKQTTVDILKFAPKDVRHLIIKKIPPKDLVSLSKVDPDLSKMVSKTKDYQELWKKEIILEKRLKDIKFSNGAYYSMRIPKKFISDKWGNIKDNLALNYILQKLLKERYIEKGGEKEGVLLPEIQYLVQHGNYQKPGKVMKRYDYYGEDEDDDDPGFVTYYPVSGLGGYYSDLGSDPIYTIDVAFSPVDDVTISSYKGNHEDCENCDIGGNLPYKGKEYNFSGLVYTRGL